jgi:hypothetical protein
MEIHNPKGNRAADCPFHFSIQNKNYNISTLKTRQQVSKALNQHEEEVPQCPMDSVGHP